VDRVSILDEDARVKEGHALPAGTNAFRYANKLVKQARRDGVSQSYLIELEGRRPLRVTEGEVRALAYMAGDE
jgi:hypothetical protein